MYTDKRPFNSEKSLIEFDQGVNFFTYNSDYIYGLSGEDKHKANPPNSPNT